MSAIKKETYKIVYCPRVKGLGMTQYSQVALIEAYTNGDAQAIFRRQYPRDQYDFISCEKF